MFPTFLAQEKTELALFIQGSAAKLAATHFLGNSNILHLHSFWEIVANPPENGSPLPSTKSGNCDLTGLINSPPPPPIRTMQCSCSWEKEGREKKRQFRKWEKGGGGTEFAKSLPSQRNSAWESGWVAPPTDLQYTYRRRRRFPPRNKISFSPPPSTSQPTLVPSPQPPPLLRDTLLLLSLLLLIIIFAVEAAGRN